LLVTRLGFRFGGMDMQPDMRICGGTVVTSEGEHRVDLLIANGRICGWASPESRFSADEPQTIDATGKYILPGIVDPHVHFNEPGKDAREDFHSGSRAAAAGGVTTVIEMPNSLPPCHSREILDRRVALAEEKMLVDFAFYGAAGGSNLDSIEDLAAGGVIGYKTFLTQPPPERAAEFEGLNADGPGELWDVFRAIARTGLVSAVHAESSRMARRRQDELVAEGRGDFMAYAESRPEVVELEATASALVLARDSGCRVQLCHVSSPRAVLMAATYKEEGVPITVESCPHYLTFTEEALREWGPYAKIAPPLRSAEHREGLWDLVRLGEIDMLGSDHAPYLPEEKSDGMEDIFKGASGLACIELILPIMMDHVASGRLTLEDVVRLMSENPARVFGLHPKKGHLYPGADADLVLIDMAGETEVDVDGLHTRGKAAAKLFDGMQLQGRIIQTMVRGKTVMEGDAISDHHGWGEFQRPSL